MNRAYSLLTVKAVDEDQRIISGIATTPEPDRMGDIVEPMGVKFQNPMPLLHQHDSEKPVGTVKFDKPTKDGITFTAKLPVITEPGPLKDRVDTAWGEVKAGLVRAVSIGFRALEYAFIEGTGGLRFIESEVLELSLVSVPANAGATITSIKSIDRPLLAATGKEPGASDRPVPPGATGKTKPHKPVNLKSPKEGNKVNIKEQIAALEKKRDDHNARRLEIQKAASDAGRTKTEAESEEFGNLGAELTSIDTEIKDLKELESVNVTTAAPAVGATVVEGSKARTPSPARSLIIERALPKGYGFVRLLGARFMAKQDGGSAAAIALSKGWGDDLAAVLNTPRDLLVKSAINPATTTDSAWAAPLVTYNNLTGEFIELLRAKSILDRIQGLRRVPFNVKVPRETGELQGYWVPQGSPKPLSAGSFDTVTLDFNKCAGITWMTQELLRFSQPNAEGLMVNSLTKALIKLVDYDFLDPSKAEVSGESPASITNGVTPVTASGLTADAFRADFGDLLAAYVASNYTLDDLVVVMSQSQALRLGLMRNDFGSKEFPDINKDGGYIEGVPVVTSENIAANGGSPADGRIIVALSANSILLADDGGVDVDISTEASVQAESAPDSPSSASTVMVSLWQRNLVGIRCERFLTWKKARTGAAQYISGANYGN